VRVKLDFLKFVISNAALACGCSAAAFILIGSKSLAADLPVKGPRPMSTAGPAFILAPRSALRPAARTGPRNLPVARRPRPARSASTIHLMRSARVAVGMKAFKVATTKRSLCPRIRCPDASKLPLSSRNRAISTERVNQTDDFAGDH
jgi:hypothetical protein